MFVEIPGFPDYFVDENGAVFSVKGRKWRKLRSNLGKSGYLSVTLRCIKRPGRVVCSIHRLVLLAFEGDCALDVIRKNGIKTDNRLENLFYGTSRQSQALHYARSKEQSNAV